MATNGNQSFGSERPVAITETEMQCCTCETNIML